MIVPSVRGTLKPLITPNELRSKIDAALFTATLVVVLSVLGLLR